MDEFRDLADRVARIAVTAAIESNRLDDWMRSSIVISFCLQRVTDFVGEPGGVMLQLEHARSKASRQQADIDMTIKRVSDLLLPLLNAGRGIYRAEDIALEIDVMERVLGQTPTYDPELAWAEAWREVRAAQRALPAGLRDFFIDDPEGHSADVAAPAADALNHALARLFLRLGPPPTPSDNDYVPVGGGGDGGVRA
ncbi:hypothetical protein [Streptomyces sp. NPDC060035]|uniref:hypothetical protein n=1 Tax=Streptomyces sp. NPDC060035 TaxID=3347044 RepID=UPI00367BF037